MSEYVDTQLLECNRLHSEEFKAGNNENPALFTNKLGSGINLDVGDVVSVHGCYVNENGAGGDTIEFKGKNLNAAITPNNDNNVASPGLSKLPNTLSLTN